MQPDATNPAPAFPPPRFFFAAALVLLIFSVGWTWFVHDHALDAFDLSCAQFWHDFSERYAKSPPGWAFMVYMTDLGGVAAMALLVVMGAIWQTGINHRFLAVAWFLVVLGGAFPNQGLKALFQRPRPGPELRDRAALERNFSYPSGHAMGSTIGYGMLGYALLLPQRRKPRRVATLILLTGIVVTIGFSRIYLRAHWFSDVIAGWAMGLAWLFLCIGLLERRRLRHVKPPTA